MARKRKSQKTSELEKMITSCKTFDEFFVLSVVSLLIVKMFQVVINPAFDGEEEARIVSNVSTESSNGSLLLTVPPILTFQSVKCAKRISLLSLSSPFKPLHYVYHV